MDCQLFTGLYGGVLPNIARHDWVNEIGCDRRSLVPKCVLTSFYQSLGRFGSKILSVPEQHYTLLRKLQNTETESIYQVEEDTCFS